MQKTATKIKTLATLETDDCRWPIGDPRQADFHFCGAPKMAGRPYCIQHWPLSFVSRKAQPGSPTHPARRAA